MKKTIGLLLLLSACQKVDEQVVIPQEISRVNINTAVHEDKTSDEGQVMIIEIEDEATFVGSDEMVKCTHCSPSFADSIFQAREKKRLQEDLIANKDSIQ